MAKVLLVALAAAAVSLIAVWQSGVLGEPVEVCAIDKKAGEKYCSMHNAVLGTLIRVGTFLEHHSEATIAACAIVLAISTTLLWLATHRLQKSIAALHEARERQSALAQQSADAATKAAAAAEASVRTMTDTTQAQLRLYASVQAALIELLEPPGGSLRSDRDQDHRPDPSM